MWGRDSERGTDPQVTDNLFFGTWRIMTPHGWDLGHKAGICVSMLALGLGIVPWPLGLELGAQG